MFSGEERNMRFLKNTCANMESSSRASEATKDCTNTDCCDDCVQLENRLRLASEHYLTLIVQRDRENWSGNRDISALDHAIRQAREAECSGTAPALPSDQPRDFISPQCLRSGTILNR